MCHPAALQCTLNALFWNQNDPTVGERINNSSNISFLAAINKCNPVTSYNKDSDKVPHSRLNLVLLLITERTSVKYQFKDKTIIRFCLCDMA